MQLVCPHCQNPIELVETNQAEVLCPSCGSSIRLENASTTAWSPPDGQRKLGKFELIERIGMGAFGTVYKARDSQLGRIVAIKVPRSGSLAGKEDLDRFMREARSVAQLRHPSIVSVYDVGQTDDLLYLVSEFVEGLTLADLLTARRRTPREAAELIAAVADTLQYAHDHGIVHRDVKPSNILLDKDGKPHLMDFGLAKRDAGEVTMTMDGQVLGTPAYMSPEQAGGEGHKVDGRSDIYSLGVILYELLTGALPFQGSTRALLHQVQHDEPRQPRSVNKSIPRDLETICLKCLRKGPGQRYTTAQDLADDLRRFLAGEPIKAHPLGAFRKTVRWFRRRREVAWMLAGAVAAVILIGTLGIIFAPEQSDSEKAARRYANTVRQTLQSVVWITSQTKDGTDSGTGTLVDMENRMVLTCHHFVTQQSKLTVFFPKYDDGRLIWERKAYVQRRDEDGIPAQVVATDPSHDLALLQLSRLPRGRQGDSAGGDKPFRIRHSLLGWKSQNRAFVGFPNRNGPKRPPLAAPKRWRPGTGYQRRLARCGNQPDGHRLRRCPLVSDVGELVGVSVGGDWSRNTLFIDVSEVRKFIENYSGKANTKPLPADLDLVPRDAFGFVSIRLADLLQNRGVMRLQERISKEFPELKSVIEKWQEEAEKEIGIPEIGIPPSNIERVTLVFLGVPDLSQNEAPENWGFAIVRTVQKYDRESPKRSEGRVFGKERRRADLLCRQGREKWSSLFRE